MNFTDPDRRILPPRDGFIAGYNGQIVVDGAHEAQLRGRWAIERKYIGHDIWVASPDAGDWHLAPHDEMVRTGN